MNIDEMPAGIELDILVAEALGYVRITPLITKVVTSPTFTVVSGGSSIGDARVYIRRGADDFAYFAPSTDIAAAFQVVDKLLDGTRTFVLQCWSLKNDHWQAMFSDHHWQAMFKGKLNMEAAQYERLDDAFAETRPLAICRAALKLMKRKGEEEAARVDCQHEFFKCQVPAGDSCQPIYHQVCRKCRWDKRKGIYMPLDIWRGWALPQLEKLDEEGEDEH